MALNVKILHWNINGIRAIYKKNIYDSKPFEAYITEQQADIISFNETKICCKSMDTHSDIGKLFTSYTYKYHAHATKRGYSGVSVYSKIEPLRQIKTDIDDGEGRIIVLEFSKFILISVYVPNAGSKLARLKYRTTDWDIKFLKLCEHLSKTKPLIIVGDMNVAHMDIDINHPERHRQSAGFTDAERGNFDKLLRTCNLLDAWRMTHLSDIGYTYFDYRTKARERGAGWRIDYVLISAELQNCVSKCEIRSDIYGSDHIPIVCTLKK